MSPQRESPPAPGSVAGRGLSPELIAVGVAVLGSALAVAPFEPYAHETLRAAKIVFLAGAATWIGLRLVRRGGVPLRITGFDLALAGYAGLGLLSWLVNGRNGAYGLTWLALEGAGWLLVAGTVVAARRDRRHRDLLLALVTGTAVLVALVALLEALGVPLPWPGSRRPMSTLGNRNFVGAYCAIALPLAVARLWSRPRVVPTVAVGLLTLTVLLSRCRSAWLGLGLAAVLAGTVLVVRRRASAPSAAGRAPWLLGAALAGALAAAGAVPWPGLNWLEPAPLRASVRRLLDYESGSGKTRVNQYRVGLALIAERPLLGVGPQQWDDASAGAAHHAPGEHARAFAFGPTPNSDLLRIATELGVPALLVLLLGVGLLVRDAWPGAASAPSGATLAPIAALAVAAVHATFDAPLFRPASLALMMVIAGLVRAAATRSMLTLAPAAGRSLVVGLVVVVAVGSGVRVAGSVALVTGRDSLAAQERSFAWYPRSDLAQTIARRLVAAGQCDRAAGYLTTARRQSPHHWGLACSAAVCALQRGDRAAAARWRREALATEPHPEVVGACGLDETGR